MNARRSSSHLFWALGIVAVVISAAGAKPLRRSLDNTRHIQAEPAAAENPSAFEANRTARGLFTTAPIDTYLLATYDFEIGGVPDPQGWTGVDLTAQQGTFFHVDTFRVIDGSQSLWCGARPPATGPFCGYATLPGYGNSWNQHFESTVAYHPIGEVVLSFDARYDTEPNYDYTLVEYSTDGGAHWIEQDGYDGIGEGTMINVIPPADSVKFRFHFRSDGAWSDEDGLFDSEGGIIIDNVQVWDAAGLLDSQDFESEALGDTATSDGLWAARAEPGFGDFSGLFSGLSVAQDDACTSDISVLWGFFNGSTDYYVCGWPNIHPEQRVVPYRNSRGQYINNEIWSPWIEWNPGGTVPASADAAMLDFWVYRDLPLDNLIFYNWHIRSKNGASGCPGDWRDWGLIGYGQYGVWTHLIRSVGEYIDPGATHVQLALACVDMCPYWCGLYHDGGCHTQAPLFDNVSLYRLDATGPQFTVRSIDLFQDNFPSDGTIIGTVRIDAAIDRMPASSPIIYPGDSMLVTVARPGVGLGLSADGRASVYCYIRSSGGQPPAAMAAPEVGKWTGRRWPYSGIGVTAGGFYPFQMDTSYTDVEMTIPVANQFCFDLNDAFFTPPDRIDFYFAATDANGVTVYWSSGTDELTVPVPTFSQAEVELYPMEVQCLPTGQAEILYVDDYDGYGAQPYFESALELLGLAADRYDVRGPSSLVGNGLGSRAAPAQIVDIYRTIIWNSGDLNGTIGGGIPGSNEKSHSIQLLTAFLDQSGAWDPGLFISGDDIPGNLKSYGTAPYTSFFTFIDYNRTNGNHVAAGEPVSPLVTAAGDGSIFRDVSSPDPIPDSLIAYGGCPGVNDFDVLAAAGTSVIAMSYENNPGHGAVLAQETLNAAGMTARVVLEGFSYHEIRDDRTTFPPDRAEHLRRILDWFGAAVAEPTGSGGVPAAGDRLDQNYPNPFNPATMISFSLSVKAPVHLRIYNVAGQLVRMLVDEIREAGPYQEAWDGRTDAGQAAASGLYIYVMDAGGFRESRKMLLIK